MGFFSKKNEDQAPRNPSNTVMFRVLAIGYVAYLCIQMVKTYTAGGPDAPSLTMMIISVAVLGCGALFLAWLTYREWKIAKPKYDAYMAELRAEAEAKRAAEEQAEEPDELDEEEEYEALESGEEVEEVEESEEAE